MLTCGSILAVNLSPPALTFSRLGSCLPSVPAVLGSRDCTCPLAAASVADEAMTIDGQPTTSEGEKERAHDEARAVAMTSSKVVNDDVAVLPTAIASAERADESEIEVDAAEKNAQHWTCRVWQAIEAALMNQGIKDPAEACARFRSGCSAGARCCLSSDDVRQMNLG